MEIFGIYTVFSFIVLIIFLIILIAFERRRQIIMRSKKMLSRLKKADLRLIG